MFKVVTWNVRGANNENKRRLIRSLLQQWGADIYVLVETKLTGADTQLIKQLWFNRWLGELHLEAVGRSGGIAVLWDRRMWKGELVEASGQVITCRFEGINTNLTWFLSSIYADCNEVIRRELWRDLINLKNTCTGPWLFCGDFNVTRYPMERSTGQRLTGAKSDFTDWINEMELIDPPLFGGLYTWRRGENHSTASRLDRFLYSHHWDDSFSQIRQSLLPRLESDHNPVMLTCGELN